MELMNSTLPWMPSGTSPVRYAVNWGAFDAPNVVAVHCVHVNDEDVRIMKTYDVAACICSRTNAQLGMGVAPIRALHRANLRMGFGSDSLAAKCAGCHHSCRAEGDMRHADVAPSHQEIIDVSGIKRPEGDRV